MSYTLLILALPILMFLVLGLGGSKMKPAVAGLLGTLGLSVVAICSYATAYEYFFVAGKVGDVYQKLMPYNFEWLTFTDKLHIDLGIMLDPISVMMLVVISTVSLMVHIYSFGYMKGERGFQRYYALLSLFTFSMLGLVVAGNIFQMYIFWELVGVSSYSLIGFYYLKPSAIRASKKAFIVTRFADFFFLVGILLVSYFSGSFDFATLTDSNAEWVRTIGGASFLGISALSWGLMLIFMGGAGKSAMLPFHIWLPDAMEGPTPVSALIHAATMVVAGVFLVARLFPIYVFGAPEVLTIISYVGAITALFAAVVACTQTDIKRVLAFSTISQIAYMITALGVSGYGGHDGLGYMASMFHLFTHAFFKALLFLGAGAVIHAVHSNEMADMGGLKKYLPITHITFLIACLAIAGIPPFSGFFSKDEILVAAFHHDKIVFCILYFVAGLTAFYMFRLYYRIFWGENEKHYHHEPHEGGVNVMTIPLIFLGLLTLVTGFIPFSKFITSDGAAFHTHIDWLIAPLSVGVGVVGIAIATILYRKHNEKPDKIAVSLNGLYVAASRKFYFDEVWLFVTKTVIFKYISAPIAWFDRHVIDGFMNMWAYVSNWTSSKIKGIQSGVTQDYAWAFIVGALVIVVLSVWALV
ncbi:NADH dehydrogenase subunit L [Bacteroidia bacterium]|nr:NADH dehydrogenase subunit L [Bacteroidia bacterium]